MSTVQLLQPFDVFTPDLLDYPIYTGLVLLSDSLPHLPSSVEKVSAEFIDSTLTSHTGVGFWINLRSVR